MNIANVRKIADAIEAMPDRYDQGLCPVEATEGSCGCVAHFVQMQTGEIASDAGTWGWSFIKSFFDCSEPLARSIFGWQMSTEPMEAVERLRRMADADFDDE